MSMSHQWQTPDDALASSTNAPAVPAPAAPVPATAASAPAPIPVPAAPPRQALQMKHRSPFAVWILSVITFGIYQIVHWYKIHAELAEFDPRVKINPVWETICLTVLGWTGILPWISICTFAGKVRAGQRAAGLPAQCSGTAAFWLTLLFGMHLVYYQSKLNQIIDTYDVPAGEPVALKA